MKVHARQVDPPDDDESYEDFMDRCTDEMDDDSCQVMWDERAAKGIVHKTHAAAVAGMEFVMSDETADRMDDVILSDGWDLQNFKKNPIALFGHRSDFPIGKWSNLRVENKQLRGQLELAPAGTSDRIDEIRRLIDAGILRAVSVGFRPIERQPINEKADEFWGPFKFLKQELVETSLVSVPANPNALQIAKSLKISPETQQLVFAGHGRRNALLRRGLTGGHADRKPENRKGTTMSLAQRITELEQQTLAKKDELKAFHDAKGDGNYTDADIETVNTTTAAINHDERTLAALRESERISGITSDAGGRAMVPAKGNGAAPAAPRPFSFAAKKPDPIELFLRAGTSMILAQRERSSVDEMRRKIYGDDESTKAMLEWQTKAASQVATTTLVGWAAELVQQFVVDFMQLLMVQSVFAPLSAAGLALSFGRNGKIVIPTRSRTPTIAGSFVGEGLPIPVRQGAFTSQTLTPKKMAVITTWTREIDEHSVPAIQGLLRDAIQYDTGVALDAILLDANPATAIRPPGILNGVSGLTPTAGGGFAALVGDIKALTGALLTGTLGNVRNPRWLMNPQQANSIGLVAAPGAGVFPFREEISQGRLSGWPVIVSGTVPAGTVIVIDAADFVSVAEGPRFEISDQATLHMEDTTPTDISTTGTPAVVAFPAKSMFQTDSMALRLIMPMNWVIRRTGTVAWVAGVTW
jgi:HK97 family phage major capsid protein/HK97 family phage prohead protease